MKDTKAAMIQQRQAGRILIVDDEVDFAHSLMDILETRDYQVRVAHSALQAQEEIAVFDAQVALLDVRLGSDSGIDLISQLRETRPALLCVMMTAFAAVETAVKAIHQGAYDYLQKPLDIQNLLLALERYFENLQLEHDKVTAEKSLRARNRQLDLLNKVGQKLAITLDKFSITEQLLPAVTEIVGAEAASVWMWEETEISSRQALDDMPQDWVVCRAASIHEQGRSPLGMRVRLGQGVVGWVVLHGKSDIGSNTPDTPTFFPGIDKQTGFHTRSLLAVPLWVRGKVIGALEVVNKVAGDFDAQDAALLETLAASAAIAIDNAQLVEALGSRTLELQARNEDLDAYAHTVAHDLKGPLGHIVGFAYALQEDVDDLSGDELRGYLRTMAQSGRKMSNIIDELLLLASLHKLDIELEPLDMARVVRNTQERLAYMIDEYQADVILPQDAWPAALGHGPWIEEVWVNYLSNALKYGGRPPRVELGFGESANRRISEPAQTRSLTDGSTELAEVSYIRFWVRDNGPGLTPEEQGRLFRSFEQLDRVRAKGHGLGLSIARRIVKKIGGEVGVESEVGVGSIFWFTLPAQPQGR